MMEEEAPERALRRACVRSIFVDLSEDDTEETEKNMKKRKKKRRKRKKMDVAEKWQFHKWPQVQVLLKRLTPSEIEAYTSGKHPTETTCRSKEDTLLPATATLTRKRKKCTMEEMIPPNSKDQPEREHYSTSRGRQAAQQEPSKMARKRRRKKEEGGALAGVHPSSLMAAAAIPLQAPSANLDVPAVCWSLGTSTRTQSSVKSDESLTDAPHTQAHNAESSQPSWKEIYVMLVKLATDDPVIDANSTPQGIASGSGASQDISTESEIDAIHVASFLDQRDITQVMSEPQTSSSCSSHQIEVLQDCSTVVGVNGTIAQNTIRELDSARNDSPHYSQTAVVESTAELHDVRDYTQMRSTMGQIRIRDLSSIRDDASGPKCPDKEIAGSVFFCRICGTSIVSLLALIAHDCVSTLNHVIVEDKLMCMLCGAGFSSSSELSNHSCMRILCCSKVFQTFAGYRLHHCASSNQLQKYTRFCCQGCRKHIISVRLLSSEDGASEYSYCPECKLSSDPRDPQGETSDTQVIPAAKEFSLSCSSCLSQFSSEASYKNHSCQSGALASQNQSISHGKNSFICNQCKMIFCSKHFLDRHICKQASARSTFQCQYCLCEWKSQEELTSHNCCAMDTSCVRSEDRENKMYCPRCSRDFEGVQELALHMYSCCYRRAIQRVPPSPSTKETSCSVCSKTFDLPEECKWHMCVVCLRCKGVFKDEAARQAHLKDSLQCREAFSYSIAEIQKMCLWCGTEVAGLGSGGRKSHIQKNRPCLDKELRLKKWVRETNKCLTCGVTLKGEEAHVGHYIDAPQCMNRWLVSMHQQLCEGDCWKCAPPTISGGLRDFPCMRCSRVFATNWRRMEHFSRRPKCLKYHMLISPLSFPCLSCGCCFASKQKLDAHGSNCKKSAQKGVCHACGQQFLSDVDCRNHIRFTADCARSFPCMTCAKTFIGVQERARHFLQSRDCRLQHLLASFEMFVCKTCFSCFNTSDSYNAHVMDPFQCTNKQQRKCLKCRVAFADLEGHCSINVECAKAQRNAAPLGFACWGCGKGYLTKAGLRDHMLEGECFMTEERWMWRCAVCNKCFQTLPYLQRHCQGSFICKYGCQGFKCWGCWRTFSIPESLEQHVPDCCGKWNGGWCRVCQALFDDLEAHCSASTECGRVLRAHNSMTLNCCFCQTSYLTRQGLRQHLRNDNCSFTKASTSINRGVRCLGCCVQIKGASAMRQHLSNSALCFEAWQHTLGQGFTCLGCGKTLLAVTNHLKDGSCSTEKTTVPSKSLTSGDSQIISQTVDLAEHETSELPSNQIHSCPCCLKLFVEAESLTSHYKQNHRCAAHLLKRPVKMYTCMKCRRCLSTTEECEKHLSRSPQCQNERIAMRTLTHIHRCLNCGKSFRKALAWEKHFDKRPQCAIAGRVDVSKQLRGAAVYVFPCGTCKNWFGSKSSREQHFASCQDQHSSPTDILHCDEQIGDGNNIASTVALHEQHIALDEESTAASASPEKKEFAFNHCMHCHVFIANRDLPGHLKENPRCEAAWAQRNGACLCRGCCTWFATRLERRLHHDKTSYCAQHHRQESLLDVKHSASAAKPDVAFCEICWDAYVVEPETEGTTLDAAEQLDQNTPISCYESPQHSLCCESSTQEITSPCTTYEKWNGDLQLLNIVTNGTSYPALNKEWEKNRETVASGWFQREGAKELIAEQYVEVNRTYDSDIEILEVNSPEARSESYCCSLCHINMDFVDMDAEQRTSEHLICTKCSIKSEKPALEGEEQGFLCTKCNKTLTVDTLESHSCAIFSGSDKASEESREMKNFFRETNRSASEKCSI